MLTSSNVLNLKRNSLTTNKVLHEMSKTQIFLHEFSSIKILSRSIILIMSSK